MTFFLKQIQFSFLIHCILSNYSLANVAGVLGPFDCMAFLFTIVHKVCSSSRYFKENSWKRESPSFRPGPRISEGVVSCPATAEGEQLSNWLAIDSFLIKNWVIHFSSCSNVPGGNHGQLLLHLLPQSRLQKLPHSLLWPWSRLPGGLSKASPQLYF